jgi:ABC-2 type transport system permease protein
MRKKKEATEEDELEQQAIEKLLNKAKQRKNKMKTILKKELHLFVSQPTIYIITALFITISSLFIWLFSANYNIYNSGYASLNNFFEIAPWLLLFIIPALSMQLLAQEEFSGTLDWLFVQPISIANIVQGKLLALFIFCLFILSPTLFYVYTIFNLSTPQGNLDFGQLSLSYLGLFLLSFAFSSIGLFASSFTKNQVTAYLVGLVLNFIFYFGFQNLASYQLLGSLDTVLQSFGFTYHYNFFLKGIFDTRNAMFFVLIICLFYFLTVYNLKSKKTN